MNAKVAQPVDSSGKPFLLGLAKMLIAEVAGMSTILFYAAGKKACLLEGGSINFLVSLLI